MHTRPPAQPEPILRAARPDDHPALRTITLDAIQQTGRAGYDARQVAAWASWAADPAAFQTSLARGLLTPPPSAAASAAA